MMVLRPAGMTMLLGFFAAMVALGAIPGSASTLASGVGDKTLHVLAYAFMTALCFLSVRGNRCMQSVATLLIIALLGLIDESLQFLLPYRNASLLDWCFDIAAAIVVITFMNLFTPATTKTSSACEKKSAKPFFLSQD